MIIEETTKIDMFQIQTMNNNTIAKLIIMIEIYINKILITQMKKKNRKENRYISNIDNVDNIDNIDNINFGKGPNNNETLSN